jgi:hypothetical protein
MTPRQRQDFGGGEWRLRRARSLIQRAQAACREGDLAGACALAIAALEQIPQQLVKRHIMWPTQ